ncbi:M-phase inducer phosphatase-like [Corticium candelabrum]|uniref:M-phase inducer phosphatase-like n=1 Tax=Corticium candelabrum TaxID=121492 RepID=UPI002E258128|nr:M-phase inducer phosphatase-like [Corticium candelabrum]
MENEEEKKRLSLRIPLTRTLSLSREAISSSSPFSSKTLPIASPMTNLAMELSMSSVRTPRRRLSLSSNESNTPCSPLEADISGRSISQSSAADQGYQSGSWSEPITPLSPADGMLGVGFLETPKRTGLRRSSSFATVNTPPCVPEDEKENNKGFVFARPVGIRLRRKAFLPATQSITWPDSGLANKLSLSAVSPGDVFESTGDGKCIGTSSSYHQRLPSGFSDLIKKPIIVQAGGLNKPCDGSDSQQEVTKDGRVLDRRLGQVRPALKCLSESALLDRQSPTSLKLPAVKRSNPSSSPSPGAKKKSRAYSLSVENAHSSDSNPFFTHEVSPIRRCYSMPFTSPLIDQAFGIGCEDADLIGDFTKPHALPIVNSNKALKNITVQTLSELMNQEYESEIGRYVIVDCRYPFEYSGGHIKGSKNLYLKDQIEHFFMQEPLKLPQDGRRLVIIFHCEFSSERGPTMCKYLRERDRSFHASKLDYPTLYYPEMYLLFGGYKVFYAECKELCEPNGYTSMNDEKYLNELKHFSKKAKSWSGETPRVSRTGLKNC